MHNREIAALNHKYEAFWDKQSADALVRMEDADLRQAALADLTLTIADGEGIRRQKTLEQSLIDAEIQRAGADIRRAQKAGQACKADPLNLFMKDTVLKNPKIKLDDFLKLLAKVSGPGELFEIVDGTVEFATKSRREISVPLPTLKHRLSRMKKKLKKP